MKNNRVKIENISKTFLHAVLDGFTFWIAVFISNSEPEISYMFVTNPVTAIGSLAGVFSACFAGSLVVVVILDLAEYGVSGFSLREILSNALYTPTVLTLALFAGFQHGSTTLYYQYSALEFAPIFAGSILAWWFFLINVDVIFSVFGALFNSIYILVVKRDRQNTSTDRIVSKSISWQIPDDK